MKAIVEAHRWPDRILVGDGAQAAWLLVQHTDHDPAFSEAALSCWACRAAARSTPPPPLPD